VPRSVPRGDIRSCAAGEDGVPRNNVQRYREALMMSKAELARKAGLSTLTIDRVEAGRPCRLDTKRKILLALGKRVSDKDEIFGVEAGEALLALASHAEPEREGAH
jgi:DNA-binding XRE family transcriptional regulator